MDALLATTRAIHFGSTLIVFGELVFALFVAAPAWRGAAPALDRHGVERRIRGMLIGSLAVSVVSDVLWLALEVPLMSGEALTDAITGPTLDIVVTQTWFGRVWAARVLLAVGLGAWLALRQPLRFDPRRASVWFALVIAAAYVASPALAGHAAGGPGTERYVRIGADVLHLLAAGAWVGALPGLAVVLIAARRDPDSIEVAARATRAFSSLGTIAVALVVASGTISAVYLVGSMGALVDTGYGRLLTAKLALAAAMLALAAVNRWSLSPRIAARDRIALDALVRNTALEIVGGVAVVALVGFLGITVPAMHPAHHELHSATSRAIIPNSPLRQRSWPNPTSSTSRFRKVSTTTWRRSSAPTPCRRIAWTWRCSTDFSLRSSAVRS
jgi:copper resistance protein D